MQLLPTYYLPRREEYVRFNHLNNRYAYSDFRQLEMYNPHKISSSELWVKANYAQRITNREYNEFIQSIHKTRMF